MLRVIKYELNPTNTQKVVIKQTCGCCRKVYNTMLDRKIRAYKEDGKKISTYDLIKELVPLKEELPYLKEVPSQTLQQAVMNREGLSLCGHKVSGCTMLAPRTHNFNSGSSQ